jgi:hypothetical protein
VSDAHVLHAQHPGQVLELLARHGPAERRVMRAASEEPSLTGPLEIRTRYPNCSCHRELRHRVLDFDDVDLLDDESHPSTHVDEGGGDRWARRRVEDETARGFFAADPERMDLERRLAVGD